MLKRFLLQSDAMAAVSETFSDNETFTLLFGLFAGLVLFLRWYKALLFHGKFAAPRNQRLPLFLVPPLGLVILQFVLLHYADPVVRTDGDYQLLFLLLALVWFNAARFVTPLLGISITADVIERNNPAAVVALSDAFASVLLVYAGGNVGSGPTIWSTLYLRFWEPLHCLASGLFSSYFAILRLPLLKIETWPLAFVSQHFSSLWAPFSPMLWLEIGCQLRTQFLSWDGGAGPPLPHFCSR